MNAWGSAGKAGVASASFSARVASKFPVLMAVWLFLAVLGPHQELYKVFFHGIIAPAVLVLLFSKRLSFAGVDSLLKVALCFFVYAGITTFFIGLGPIDGHFRALRWSIEAAFGLLALWAWLPDVMRRPVWWAKYLLVITCCAALAGILKFVLLDDMQGRLTGFGGLHNPIHAGAVFIVFLAIAHFVLAKQVAPTAIRDRLLLLFTLALVALAVLLSESRGPIVAMLAYLPFIAIVELHSGVRLRSFLMSIVAIAMVVGAVVISYGPESLMDQLMARGTSYRLEIWKGYIDYPPDSWLFGFGLGTESQYVPAVEAFWKPNGIPVFHPHSVYVGTLVETGIIGVLFLILMAVLLFKAVYSSAVASQEKVRLVGLLGLVFILTLTVSQGVISSIKMLWLFFWFPVAFVWFWSKVPPERTDR